jgi:uncharacterized Zn finger protein
MSKTITIDKHRGKSIEFNIEVEGLDYDTIHGKFRIMSGDIEYGFPTVFTKNQRIEVIIPPLNGILRDSKKKSLKAKLEICTDCQYFVPWEGTIKLKESAGIKVQLKKTTKPKVKVKTEMKDNEVTEDLEVIVDDPEKEVSLPEPKEKKKLKKTKANSIDSIDEDSRDTYLNMLKNIDEEGIRTYMKKAGTTNDKVQSIILEQAENICKDPEDKFELLKSVVKVMKKIKKGDN